MLIVDPKSSDSSDSWIILSAVFWKQT